MNTEHTTIYNTTSTVMYIPGNSAEEDDEDEDDTYYSIIPDRAQAMRERWKYIFRRTCFYVFLGTVFGGTIAFPFIITNLTVWFWITYLLWFELDVTVSKNALLVQVIHSLAFNGSFLVCILATLLMFVFNPDFLAERARLEHHSVFIAYIFTAWMHWFPPFFMAFDLYLHREHAQRRHKIDLRASFRKAPSSQPIYQQLLKVFWVYTGPFFVMGAWFLAGFTPQKVYGVKDAPYKIAIPVAVVVQLIVATFYIRYVRLRHKKEERIVN